MATLILKQEIEVSLSAVPMQGKRLIPLMAFGAGGACPIKILEDSRVSDNAAEVHETEEDIWFCLEGSPTFTYGGKLVDPEKVKEHEWRAKAIRGGATVTLKPGDWLWIPAGEPHQHNCPDGAARMVIIKVPVNPTRR